MLSGCDFFGENFTQVEDVLTPGSEIRNLCRNVAYGCQLWTFNFAVKYQ